MSRKCLFTLPKVAAFWRTFRGLNSHSFSRRLTTHEDWPPTRHLGFLRSWMSGLVSRFSNGALTVLWACRSNPQVSRANVPGTNHASGISPADPQAQIPPLNNHPRRSMNHLCGKKNTNSASFSACSSFQGRWHCPFSPVCTWTLAAEASYIAHPSPRFARFTVISCKRNAIKVNWLDYPGTDGSKKNDKCEHGRVNEINNSREKTCAQRNAYE